MTDNCRTQDTFQERGISFPKLENLCYGRIFYDISAAYNLKRLGLGLEERGLVIVEIVCFPLNRDSETELSSLKLQTEYG